MLHGIRLVAAILVVVVLALGLALGCSPRKIVGPNTAPETTLFVDWRDSTGTGPDTTHTVNHVVHLYWFGSDRDGFVVAYEIRFIETGGPADPPWTRTTETDSVFTIPSPTGIASRTFQVRAIDDQGNVDASPDTQDMRFDNQAPTIALTDPPRTIDTTFASLTISWIAGDVDGDPTAMRYRVLLNGNDANAVITTKTTFTLPTALFVEGGKLRTGRREVSVQAIDDGGRVSTPATANWFVRSPVADSTRWLWPPSPGQHPRLLIVDDHPAASNSADNTRYDTLLTKVATNKLPAGSFQILRLEFNQPFRSSEDMRQTLSLYDGAIWYRGQQRMTSSSTSSMIRRLADGITAYVDQGGRFLFESLDMVEGLGTETPGILPYNLLSPYLGSKSLYQRVAASGDSTADWGILRFYTEAGVTKFGILRSSLQDSLRCEASVNGIRALAVEDTGEVVLWARDSILTPQAPNDAPVAVTHARGSGRFIGIAVPMALLRGGPTPPAGPPFPNNLERFWGKLFDHMGLNGP